MAINAGYMGSLTLGGIGNIRFESASVSAKQEIVAPDLIMGDYDKDSFYYGKIIIDGDISGPADETFASTLWAWATERNECGLLEAREVDIYYYCGDEGKRHLNIPQALINTLRFSAQAGEVAQFSIGLIGSGAGEDYPSFDNTNPTPNQEIKKLITWEKCGVEMNGGFAPTLTNLVVNSFEISINNNVTAAYSLSQENLWPAELICGIRSIEGSVTIYNLGDTTYPEDWDAYGTGPGTFKFNIGASEFTTNVFYQRIDPKASVGPVQSTVRFVGIGPNFR